MLVMQKIPTSSDTQQNQKHCLLDLGLVAWTGAKRQLIRTCTARPVLPPKGPRKSWRDPHIPHLNPKAFLFIFLLLLLQDMKEAHARSTKFSWICRKAGHACLHCRKTLLFLRIRHLLLLGLLHVQLDREANELGVLLDQVLQASLLQELRLVLLEVADDLGA